MQTDLTDRIDLDPESANYPNPQDVLRMIVINNSQIISGLMRTGLILSGLGSLIALLTRWLPVGQYHTPIASGLLAIFATSLGFFIASNILDKALRRCPVCRTRI